MADDGSAGNDEAFVSVARFIDPVQVQVARSRLEADGIPCFIQGEGIGSLHPFGRVAGIRLLVPAEHAERAGEILAEEPDDEPPPDGEAE